MNKIPVGRTIAATYGFAFGRYLTALGITWLPLLFMAALSIYFQHSLQDMMVASANGQPAMFDPRFARLNLLLQFAGLVVFAIVSVGITKEILGLRTGPRFFYAGFGAAELRVIVGYFALLLLFIVFVIAFVLAIVIFGVVSALAVRDIATPAAKGIVALVIGCLGLGVWLSLIYIFVRLTFLFLPATVAEKRIGILRSWELTAGNFWRIFIIGIVVLLPVIAFGAVIFWLLLGPGYIQFVMQHAQDQAAVQAYVAKRMQGFYQNLPLITAVGFFLNPIMYSLTLAPAAFAYRALMPVEAALVEAPSSEQLPEPIQEIIEPEKPDEHHH